MKEGVRCQVHALPHGRACGQNSQDQRRSTIVKHLNEAEVRVLGSLIEKQLATPEYYPLALNALVRACNQTSNRDPVVSYDDQTVTQAIESLREKNLVYIFYGSDSRVPKYKQMFADLYHLDRPELAVLCVLMLRGPRTVGEIRTGTNRLYEFDDLAEIEATLEKLKTQDDPALITKLPRQPGQKEVRYAHLLSGDVKVEEPEIAAPAERHVPSARPEEERLQVLESEVEALRQQLSQLRQQLTDFKKQFE